MNFEDLKALELCSSRVDLKQLWDWQNEHIVGRLVWWFLCRRCSWAARVHSSYQQVTIVVKTHLGRFNLHQDSEEPSTLNLAELFKASSLSNKSALCLYLHCSRRKKLFSFTLIPLLNSLLHPHLKSRHNYANPCAKPRKSFLSHQRKLSCAVISSLNSTKPFLSRRPKSSSNKLR